MYILYFFLILLTAGNCFGNLNVYLTKTEVTRLLGLTSELYYVRNGVVNQYALNFVVLIPAHLSELYFTWQSLGNKPLPYSMSIEVSDRNALSPPQLNISMKGMVPIQQQTFRIILPCSGAIDAEVDVRIGINITQRFNSTTLSFRRKKICLKDPAVISNDNNNHPNLKPPEPEIVTESGDNSEDSAIYAALGCACAFLAILALLASACCARSRHKARRHDHESRLMVASSQISGPLLHGKGVNVNTYTIPAPPTIASNGVIDPPGSSSAKSAASSSYASFTSRRIPIPSSIQTSSVRHHPHHLRHHQLLEYNELMEVTSTVDPHERIAQLTIQRCRVRLKSILLEGTFGRVYIGSYAEANTIGEEDVLVKTVADHASQGQISLLLQEGMAMYSLCHPNILAVRGVSIEDHTAPYLIYPYRDFTNLKRFLLQCRLNATEGGLLTTQQLVQMAVQIASAIHYLHKKQLIHRDLSARNCVVDDNLNVLIADNALSRDLFPADYHCLGDNENRPIKWLAIESLIHRNFSTSSDVWAFGVLLWELTTLAQQPYVEIDPFEMADYLRDGYRLIQPVNCPDELFSVMAFCWSANPDERPNVQQLLSCLQQLHSQLTRFV